MTTHVCSLISIIDFIHFILHTINHIDNENMFSFTKTVLVAEWLGRWTSRMNR